MQRFYIDESGLFERIKQEPAGGEKKQPVRLVGGVIIPPGSIGQEGVLNEKMLPILKEFFPYKRGITNIHLSEAKEKAKEQLRESLKHFFKENMGGAKIAFIYNLDELKGDATPPGAHLYRSMLVNLLKAVVFYYPGFEENDSFDVNISHRKFAYPTGFSQELASDGYRASIDLKDGLTEFTAITRAELDNMMQQIQDMLGFKCKRSIITKVKKYKDWDSPFMVMADYVCNSINYILKNTLLGKPGCFNKFKSELEKTFGPESILFYSASDYDFPEHMLETFFKKGYGEFIAKVLERGVNPENSDMFMLLPAIEVASQSVSEENTPLECQNVLKLADKFLNAKNFHKMDTIEKMINITAGCMNETATTDPEYAAIFYLYHDVAMRFYNHNANVSKAIYHRDKGLEHLKNFNHITIQQIRAHHEFLNRASVIDTNEFAFGRAIKRLEPIKDREEKLNEALMAKGENISNDILGKIYGALAQNYAFLRELDNARSYFKKAVEHLGINNSQQIVYRGHLAVEERDNDSFVKELNLLLKGGFTDFTSAIDNCLSDLPQLVFTLHLLLKGMICFCNDPNEKCTCSLKVFNTIQSQLSAAKEQHPWELIFINLGDLLNEVGKEQEAIRCLQAAANFTKNYEKLTFIMIGHSARAREALFYLENNELKKVRQLISEIANTFKNLRNNNEGIGILNPDKKNDYDNTYRSGWFDDIGNKILKNEESDNKSILKSLLTEFIERFTFNYW